MTLALFIYLFTSLLYIYFEHSKYDFLTQYFCIFYSKYLSILKSRYIYFKMT